MAAELEDVMWVTVDLPHIDVGRVTTVVAGGRALCITRTADGWGVLDNRCPHQGGPLGDGQLENGYVICPWHAYEYDPSTGKPPPGFTDGATAYPTRMTANGTVEVGLPVIVERPSLMAQMVGPGAFQEIPLGRAFEAVASFSQPVLSPGNATELAALAMKHAIVERDVTHLIFPDEVQELAGRNDPPAKPRTGRVAAATIAPPSEELDRAVDRLRNAARPAIVCGNGARPFRDA